MGRNRKQRRQQHGSAWHWKQTDCWYYTLPGTKKRVPLFNEQGQRIHGKDNQEAAETALAKVKVATDSGDADTVNRQRWLVAKVCSEYLQYCQRGVTNHTISEGHHVNAASWLNDLCAYCGALAVAELKKGHIKTWIESHPTWRSLATHRSVIAVVLAAFNYAEEQFNVLNPLKGLEKPGIAATPAIVYQGGRGGDLRRLRRAIPGFPLRRHSHRPPSLLRIGPCHGR